MTIILNSSDLTKSLADIQADRGQIKDFVKPGIAAAVKAASKVLLLHQGRLLDVKDGDKVVHTLGANQSVSVHILIA